jgi:hypothetical protein
MVRVQFFRRYAQVEFLSVADDRDLQWNSNQLRHEVTMEVINSRYGLACERNNHITFAQASTAGRTS